MRFLFVFLQILWFVSASFSLTREEEKYLTEIPFLPTPIKPLVVIDMDYSGSMLGPAYYGCSLKQALYCSGVFTGCYWISWYECNANPDLSKRYYGYFDSQACYSYNTTEEAWEKSECDCSANGGVGTENCLSGNFLNWLVSSRIDVALKALDRKSVV